jgi:hypothetical protein
MRSSSRLTSSAASASSPCLPCSASLACVLRLAQRLELGFHVAQLGQPRLQVGGGLFGGAPRPGFLAGGVARP